MASIKELASVATSSNSSPVCGQPLVIPQAFYSVTNSSSGPSIRIRPIIVTDLGQSDLGQSDLK